MQQIGEKVDSTQTSERSDRIKQVFQRIMSFMRQEQSPQSEPLTDPNANLGEQVEAAVEKIESLEALQTKITELLRGINFEQLLTVELPHAKNDLASLINIATKLLLNRYESIQSARNDLVNIFFIERRYQSTLEYSDQTLIEKPSPENREQLLQQVAELPTNVGIAESLIHLYSDDPTRIQEVGSLAWLELSANSTSREFTQALQARNTVEDEQLVAELNRSLAQYLGHYQDRGLYPQTSESYQRFIANLHNVEPRTAIAVSAHIADQEHSKEEVIGMLGTESMFPFPLSLLQGLDSINVKSAEEFQPMNVGADEQGLGEYTVSREKREIDLYYSGKLPQQADGQYVFGEFSFATRQEVRSHAFIHELAHHAHSYNFSVTELQIITEVMQADLYLNDGASINTYVAVRSATAINREQVVARETIATSFELMHKDMGLFALIAPNLYTVMTGIVISRVPTEQQGALRKHLETVTHVSIGQKTAHTSQDAFRTQYFEDQNILLNYFINGTTK